MRKPPKVAIAPTSKGKKQAAKGKKIGRSKKKPCHMRYVAERRWIRNKARRVVRQYKRHKNWNLPSNLDREVRDYCLKLLAKAA
jgi:hypothetical protein